MKPLHEHLPDFGREPDRITAMITAFERLDRENRELKATVERLQSDIEPMRKAFAMMLREVQKFEQWNNRRAGG
jgi:predicted RNase H-like nuclease (RuvC/YqgF family)